MGRKRRFQGLGAGLLTSLWIASALVVQATAGVDLGAAGRQLERRIEEHLREGGAPAMAAPPSAPDRSREEAIDPSELVSV